jgi:Ca2+/Na+ antiporter
MPNLNPAPKKPHTAGILSFLTTLAGVVMTAGAYVSQAQAVAQATGVHLPAWVGITGLAITGVGATLQAVTKPVHAGDTDLVPKTN